MQIFGFSFFFFFLFLCVFHENDVIGFDGSCVSFCLCIVSISMCHSIQPTSFSFSFDQADVAEVLQILEKKKLTSLPVLVNGKFSGFVGERICFFIVCLKLSIKTFWIC